MRKTIDASEVSFTVMEGLPYRGFVDAIWSIHKVFDDRDEADDCSRALNQREDELGHLALDWYRTADAVGASRDISSLPSGGGSAFDKFVQDRKLDADMRGELERFLNNELHRNWYMVVAHLKTEAVPA